MKNLKFYLTTTLISMFLLTSCGGSGGENGSKEKDNTPPIDATVDDFQFPAVTDIQLSTSVESESISVMGINVSVAVSVTGGEYSIDNQPFTSTIGEVTNGQTIRLKSTSASDYSSTQSVELTVGNLTRRFDITTIAADIEPDAFSFSAVTTPIFDQWFESDPIDIKGIQTNVPITVSNGEYSINNAEFTSENGVVNNGDKVIVRAQSASQGEVTTSATLTVSDISATFKVTTLEDKTAPTGELIFPFGKVMTQYETITVRGKADDENGISEVKVNGINAVSDDNFKNWTANIPLESGINELSISVTDKAENKIVLEDVFNTQVQRQAISKKPNGITIDNKGQFAYLINKNYNNIIKVNLITGNQELVSDFKRGEGVDFQSPSGIVIDPQDKTLYVIDYDIDALIKVDIKSGDRSVISSASKGTGELFNFPYSLSLDKKNNRVFTVDIDKGAIFEINLINGNRKVISSNTEGKIAKFYNLEAVTFDERTNKLYVADSGLNAIFKVDINTGKRISVHGSWIDGGGTFNKPVDIKLDKLNNRLLVLRRVTSYEKSETYQSAIISIDLVTGERKSLSISDINSPIKLESPSEFSLTKNNQKAYVIDYEHDGILEVDLKTGSEKLVSKPTGLYENRFKTSGIYNDKNNNRLILSSGRSGSLYSFDLKNATLTTLAEFESSDNTEKGKHLYRTTIDTLNNHLYEAILIPNYAIVKWDLSDPSNSELISSESKGTGSILRVASYPEINPITQKLYVYNSYKKIVEIDIKSGDREDIIGEGTNIPITTPRSYWLDSKLNRLFVANHLGNTLYEVNLTDKTYKPISGVDAGIGEGIEIRSPGRPVYDATNNNIYMSNYRNYEEGRHIIKIDLETGNREQIFTHSMGMGEKLVYSDVAVIPEKQLVFTKSGSGIIKLLDLVSGDRVSIFPSIQMKGQ